MRRVCGVGLRTLGFGVRCRDVKDFTCVASGPQVRVWHIIFVMTKAPASCEFTIV